MNILELPLVVEPEQIEALLNSPELQSELLIVDLCKHDTYAQAHIPGAVHLDYTQIVAANKPVMGLLPDPEILSQLFSSIGLTANKHVVAYDDEGGGRAARLIWTLDSIGHPRSSLLNGGLHSWLKEKHPVVNTEKKPTPSEYQASIDPTPIADRHFILEHLDDEQVVLLDSRSPEEYRGERKFADRAGRIPGAVNLDWFLVMDKTNNFRLKPLNDLHTLLKERGISEDKTVVTYCQTHHRSALTYFVLKALGYARIKGYPGSWSDWGNREDTPIELG